MGLLDKIKSAVDSIDKEKIGELVGKVEDTIETMADGAVDMVKECVEDVKARQAQKEEEKDTTEE